MQLAERNMEGPLFGSYLPQAVQWQVDAFADADSGGTDEQEGIGVEIIGTAQLLLQELIVLEGKRSRKMAGSWREVFPTNEIGLKGMAVGGQLLEQPPELNEMVDAGSTAQGWLMFAQRAEPTEEMGIATKLREPTNLWEGGTEIGEEAACGRSISHH
jgi:hypothetical protein